MYNFFSEATSSAMTSILNNAPLIKKVYIPKYLSTFARIASSVINIMASFAALILVMVFMRMELHYTLFLGIIPLFCVIVLATGVGLILATATVKFRDNDIFVRRIPDLYDCKFESADNHYEYVP